MIRFMSGPNLVYFDLETQKSAAEVGGWHNKRAMKVALGVTYSTLRARMKSIARMTFMRFYRNSSVPTG